MTTPAHCTRTWTSTPCYAEQSGIHACSALDSYHHVQHVCVCGNVEPLADVAATPDPRLNVVEHAMRRSLVDNGEDWHETARRILDALDAMRSDEMSIYDFVAGEGWTEEQSFTPAPRPDGSDRGPCATCGGPLPGPDMGGTSRCLRDGRYFCSGECFDQHRWQSKCGMPLAPAGLTPAQEIRLELTVAAIAANAPTITRRDLLAEIVTLVRELGPLVEHGPDETPDLRPSKEWRDALMQTERGWKDAAVRAEQAEARADLAEARLGHIADALRDLGGQPPAAFLNALQEILAWTPDDTAPADAATGYCTGCGAESRSANLWKCPDCGWPYCVQACQAEHTKLGICPITADAATGDGDGG